MPYRKLGYRQVTPGRLIIPSALKLMKAINDKKMPEYAISKALVTAFTSRTHMKTLNRDDFLVLREDPNFAEISMYKAMMNIIYPMLYAGGLGMEDFRPARLEYISDPIMTIDEVINEALGEFVDSKLPPPDAFPAKEKTTVEMFRGQVLYTIQELSTINRKRMEMLSHFQRYMGNLLYQMFDGTLPYSAIGPFERSVMSIYIYGQNQKYRVTSIGTTGSAVPLRFPIARDADPILEETMVRLRKVCEVGNWTNYTRIISNKDPRELIYYVAPVLDKLTFVSGDLTERGPYCDIDLKETETLSWGIDQHMDWFRSQVSFQTDDATRYITTGWRAPASELSHMNIDVQVDHPDINLSFQAVSPTQDRLVAAWQSEQAGRRVTDLSGATMAHFLQDLAMKATDTGTVNVGANNIHEWKWVDLSDQSMENREVTGLYTKSDLNPLSHNVYYLRNGTIHYAKINMTEFYFSKGRAGFKPALIEYMEVARDWFFRPVDSKMSDYILGKLSISRFDVTETVKLRLIDLSVNIALYKHYTGRDPSFDVLTHLRGACDRPLDSTALNNAPKAIL